MRRFVTIALLLALAGGTTYLFAQNDEAPPAKPAPKAEAKPAAPDAADPKKNDLYALPEGNDSKILGLFLQRIARTPPPERSQQGILDHLTSIAAAATELMSREIDEELYVNAADVRVQVYSLLPQLGDNTGVAKREKLLDELKKDQREGVQQFVARMELMDRISRIPSLSEEAQEKLIAELAEKLSKATIQEPEEFQTLIQLSMQAAEAFDELGNTKLAVAAYTAFAKEMEAKNEPRLEGIIGRMQGTARRIQLPGNAIEVVGTTIQGDAFNIAQLKGKVVLVDFWATWCGPCLRELPNIKRLYDAYHEKGFEVVGISLDENLTHLEEFLDKEQIAWVTLFPAEEDQRGWENPIARHYGIGAIPTAVLVNQEGKVVSMEAHGRELSSQLEKLLGPIEKKDE